MKKQWLLILLTLLAGCATTGFIAKTSIDKDGEKEQTVVFSGRYMGNKSVTKFHELVLGLRNIWLDGSIEGAIKK